MATRYILTKQIDYYTFNPYIIYLSEEQNQHPTRENREIKGKS